MNVLPNEEPERRRSLAEVFFAREREPRMQIIKRVRRIPRATPGRKPARKMETGNLLVVAVRGAVLFEEEDVLVLLGFEVLDEVDVLVGEVVEVVLLDVEPEGAML
jgi:hypothetical protein